MAKFNRICSVAGCDKPHKGLGYCLKHYLRVKHTGKTSVSPTKFEWIRSNVAFDGDKCLPYPFGINGAGYGSITHNNIKENAHRLMCRLVHGEPGLNQDARHKCRNKLCCNPTHLEWGTRSENMSDKLRDGTDNRGSKSPVSKLTEQDVLEIVRRSPSFSRRELAKEFGVSHHTVCSILSGKNWSWLTNRGEATKGIGR